jgi:hypothetical protein
MVGPIAAGQLDFQEAAVDNLDEGVLSVGGQVKAPVRHGFPWCANELVAGEQ